MPTKLPEIHSARNTSGTPRGASKEKTLKGLWRRAQASILRNPKSFVLYTGLGVLACIAPAGLTAFGAVFLAHYAYVFGNAPIKGVRKTTAVTMSILSLVIPPLATLSPYGDILSNQFSAETRAENAARKQIELKILSGVKPSEIQGQGHVAYEKPTFWAWKLETKEAVVNGRLVGSPIKDAGGVYFSVDYTYADGSDVYGENMKYHMRTLPTPPGYRHGIVHELTVG